MSLFSKNNVVFTYEEVNTLMSQIATPTSLYLVPTNAQEERQKFLADSTYNPQFTYRKANKNKGIFVQLEKIAEISDVDPAISAYIVDTIEDKKRAAHLLESIGDDREFRRVSDERFGVPSSKLFSRACKILRGNTGDIAIVERNDKLASQILTFDNLVPIFKKVFALFGLEGWSLEKSKAISSEGFRTVMKTKRVMVDPDVQVSAEKLRKTLIHEVATHALRGNNGYLTGYDVFGKPNLKEYLDDEEGLAIYNEERFGVLRFIDVKKRAALVYAAYLAQTMSFREIFNALRAVYMRQTAYEVCMRIKRGMSDTAQPGGYYRDVCYLRGFLRIRRKLANDAVTYRNMYAGKIPIRYVNLVEEGILQKPKIYPTQELIENIFKIVVAA